ncbi:hypothetical protein Goari_011256 [Gossypium aridum]|uniref:Uncharacterized protein n=1 Tax=Gossypium aridum TaxID=34290 RepID=A0A7J8WX28_GOSAI|nr:hypothetical protein [Gossypium aridum]
MFSKVQVPILGLIENMSCFKCPHCGEPSFIFGAGGARKTAAEMGLQLVGEVTANLYDPLPIPSQIPIELDIRKGCDKGMPIVVSAPDSAVSKAYHHVAQTVVMRLEDLAKA